MLGKENTEKQVADDQMDYLELAESVVGAVDEDILSCKFQRRLSCESQESPGPSSANSGSTEYGALTNTVDGISLTDNGVVEKAIFFVKTFVKEFEEKLSQCYKEVKPGSNMKKAGKFVDECKSILNDSIPPGPWKPALKKPGEYMGSFAAERHKEKEKKLYSAVLPFKDKQREVLVEAGLEVFQKFEKPFAQIIDICPLFSWKEEVLKLAVDAVSRARNYVSNINEVKKFSVDLVTQGVVLGQSKESFPISYCKDQMEDDEEFREASSTSLLYKKVGIKIIEGNTAKYYQLKGDSYGEKYGYRLFFAWESENWEEIKEKYVLSETPEEECLYILGDERKEKLASFILKEINGEDLVRQGYIDKCNKDYYERKIDMSCNFPDTPTHFIKRKKVIEELNTMFHSRSQEKEMSRVVLVSGKKGTGKSTLAGDYGFRERRKGTWTKITWINAFGHSNLKRSFSQLAKLLEIPTKIESKGGRERDIDIESTVNSIYEYFRYTRSFFVFDNANSYSEIERFLPANFPLFLNKEKPFVLITSRESWKKEGIEEIELGGFDPKESDKFLQKLLKEDKSQDDISKLGKALNYHPFDLLHAAININQQGDSINSYLKRYKAVQKRSGLQDDEKSFGIVKINIDKIREEEKLAYAILEFMTYLNSYPINVKDFFLGKSEENQQKIQYALGQLDSYSLIHLEKGIAQIHQTTQEFMRLRQEKEGKEKETLRKIIILLRNSNTTTTSHIISVWNHVSKYKKLVNDFVCLIYHEGSTILHLLAEGGNEEVIRLMLEKIDQDNLSEVINTTDKIGLTPIYYAIIDDHLEVVKYLIEKGAELIVNYESGIKCATMSGSLKVVKYLIEEGYFKLDELGEHDESPLTYAIEFDRLSVIKYLIKKRAAVNSLNDEEILHLFYYAFEPGNLDIAQFLVRNLNGVNLRSEGGESLLHYAAMYGSSDTVEYLVQNSANVNLPDHDGNSPLCYAVMSSDLDIVEYLIQNSANVNLPDHDGNSPLYYAAASGDLDIVKYLVQNGANVNSCDANIMSLLFCAVKDGGLNVVKCFVEMGIDVNQCDKHHTSLLHYAAENGRLNVVKFLIDRKADLNLQDKKGESPLHYAIQADHFNTARYLLRKGASINLVDEDNHNPLYFTTFNNILAIFSTLWEEVDVTLFNNGISSLNLSNIEFLIKVGVNVNQYNKYDRNFLHYAARDGHLGIVEYLIKKGANVNACGGRDDVKPLHYATKYGHLDVVEYLLNKGANVDACDKYGASPLHYAARMGHFNVVIHLVNSKADINLCDESSRKPLHYSIENNHLNIAYFLRMQEDNVNPAYEQSQISIRKRLRASELQDCTLPCSVNGQCVSSKRRRLENVRATSLDNHEAVNSSLETTASLVALDFELQRTLSHYNDKMQRFTQLGNSDSRELQQPIDNSVPISSLSGIVIEPGNNTVSVQPSGIRDDKLLYWSH